LCELYRELALDSKQAIESQYVELYSLASAAVSTDKTISNTAIKVRPILVWSTGCEHGVSLTLSDTWN